MRPSEPVAQVGVGVGDVALDVAAVLIEQPLLALVGADRDQPVPGALVHVARERMSRLGVERAVLERLLLGAVQVRAHDSVGRDRARVVAEHVVLAVRVPDAAQDLRSRDRD